MVIISFEKDDQMESEVNDYVNPRQRNQFIPVPEKKQLREGQQVAGQKANRPKWE